MSLSPHPLSDDQFQKLVGASGTGTVTTRSNERRSSKRFAVRIDLVCQGLSQNGERIGNTFTGVTLNMSQGGVLFDTTEEIYSNLVLIQFNCGGAVIAERAVRITRRTPDHGAAVIAGDFVQAPPDNVVRR